METRKRKTLGSCEISKVRSFSLYQYLSNIVSLQAINALRVPTDVMVCHRGDQFSD